MNGHLPSSLTIAKRDPAACRTVTGGWEAGTPGRSSRQPGTHPTNWKMIMPKSPTSRHTLLLRCRGMPSSSRDERVSP